MDFHFISFLAQIQNNIAISIENEWKVPHFMQTQSKSKKKSNKIILKSAGVEDDRISVKNVCDVCEVCVCLSFCGIQILNMVCITGS